MARSKKSRDRDREQGQGQGEVARVKELRDDGLSYVEVEKRMGWTPARGWRAWAVLNG